MEELLIRDAIDIVVNPFTSVEIERKQNGFDTNFMAQVRMPESMRQGVDVGDYRTLMAEAGISHSLLIAVRGGGPQTTYGIDVPYEQVAGYCKQYPGSYSGLAGVDPTIGMQQLRDLEYAVTELGFVGAHSYPHWFRLPPNAPQWYPIYAKCCELDIPIMMQVGQNLIYSKDVRLPSVARPILLDQIAIDFPELRLIGIHVGTPWTDEMIAMAWKHENVFIGIDAYAPKHLPPSLIQYLDSYGREKVLFGTDWPVIDPRRAVSEIGNFNLKPESLRALMRDNARRVFTRLVDQDGDSDIASKG